MIEFMKMAALSMTKEQLYDMLQAQLAKARLVDNEANNLLLLDTCMLVVLRLGMEVSPGFAIALDKIVGNPKEG